MANLKEQEKWEEGVYQIEENDPVLGGENGITNKPIKQLANRTLWLKKALELFGKKSAPKDLTANSTSTADESGHSHKLPPASISAKGIVKLNSQTASDSEQDAATPKAVKIAYDKADEAKTAADNAQRSANDGINRANNAQTSANQAKSAADAAQRTANDGVSKADVAQRTANDGVSKADVAQRTANDGVSKADAALRTANDGVSKANAAQRTANDGVSKANAAQTSANQAKSAADAAQRTANDGVSKANEANNNANGRVSKSGDSMTGILHTVGIASTHFGQGAYSSQYSSGAPFLVESTGSKDRDTYHPFVKGLVRSKGHYGASFSFGYTTKLGNGDGFGRGIINLVEDNGTSKNWGFEHNGDFNSAGDVRSSGGKSLNKSVSIDDFSQNLSNNGWCKLPNGLILQWGVSTNANILFPIAFPTVCFAVSHSKTGGGRDTRIESVSRTGFKSAATGSVGTTYYIAVGK